MYIRTSTHHVRESNGLAIYEQEICCSCDSKTSFGLEGKCELGLPYVTAVCERLSRTSPAQLCDEHARASTLVKCHARFMSATSCRSQTSASRLSVKNLVQAGDGMPDLRTTCLELSLIEVRGLTASAVKFFGFDNRPDPRRGCLHTILWREGDERFCRMATLQLLERPKSVASSVQVRQLTVQARWIRLQLSGYLQRCRTLYSLR
jgi:hypothetical protein